MREFDCTCGAGRVWHPAAPKPVREWADDPPPWVEVLSPKYSLVVGQLDLGESEAIALATEVHAEVVLIDEQAGRSSGLKVAGTLSEADQAGLGVFDSVIAELRKTNFRVSQAVLSEIMGKRSR